MNIFLNQLIDSILFEWRDKSSPLNFTQYAVLPHDIETTNYCDVISPYVFHPHVWSLKPNSITLAGSELAPNRFGACSEPALNQLV